MKKYPVRTIVDLPIVTAVIVDKQGAARVQLVFDSGAVNTQLHIGTLVSVGFNFDRRTPDLAIRGVTGKQSGYSCQLKRFHFFGQTYAQLPIAAFDFSEWIKEGIDGLLGWDIVQKLHLELDGPQKVIKLF